MFYSNGKINNANSIFPPLPPFFSLYQHQQDLTTNGHDLLPASLSAPPALETTTNSCYNQTMINNWNDHVKNSEPFTTNLQLPARKLIKKRAAGAHSTKDRLRKIVTAQGPRDRRVRLSIQIARKFFDLQDTLGFDKPSKTLDWLLTKSKAAIEELALVKPTASCSITSSTVDHHEAQDTRQLKRNKALMSSKEKRITRRQQQQQNNTGFGDFARESRAKARERARERTKEKRSSKTLNIESKQLVLPHCVPSIQPNHSTTWNQIMSSHNNSTPYFNADHPIHHQFTTNYSLLNVSNSKLYSDSPYAPENWDISQSFTLVNPSTADLQNCNKLGEIYNYQVMMS